MANTPLLDIRDLHTDIEIRSGVVHALSGVDLHVNPGETLGIVGESGSGKTMTALSLMGLLPQGGRVSSGQIILDGQDLTKLPLKDKRKLRGTKVGMIFQDPLTSLNPTMKIGLQVCEPLRVHEGLSKKEALERAVEILRRVGMPRPEVVINNYPHQLSGGMRQRVMIAMALVCKPRILIADEPTTALDVTTQMQILDLIDELRDYAATHFAHEEEYMERVQYDRRFSERYQHLRFIQKLSEVDLDSVDENQQEYLLGILDFLARWLYGHIKVMDCRIPKEEDAAAK